MDEELSPGNPRFFNRSGPHTLAMIAAATGCNASVGGILISGLASLEDAGPDQISYCAAHRHTTPLE
jgi:hypothetical protein